MKRTLLEILCTLGVVVVLASFHHQISRLRERSARVEGLEALVRDAVARNGAHADLAVQRQRSLRTLERRIAGIEERLASTVARSAEARRLKEELAAARRETERIKSDLARDVMRTRELVDAYHQEIRALERKAESRIGETRSDLHRLADRVHPDRLTLTRTMLAPTVQLNGEDTVGAGTIVFSGPNASARRVETYVLTSAHVVRNILADTPKAAREGIPVTIYTDGGKKLVERADVVAREQTIDAALLRLRTRKVFRQVARVASYEESRRVDVWDPVYAVGCPLGNDPIPTQGEISSTRNELAGANYWMINAPTYFGNSGGGVYLADSRKLIGVFSKIYTHGRGSPVVVPHMGLCTPLTSIHEWLRREKLDYVLQGSRDLALEVAATPGK